MSVLVLGAGPVGQTAALALAGGASRSWSSTSGRVGTCRVEGDLPTARRPDFWSELGARAIADEGLTWSRARTFYGNEELFVVELSDPGRSPFPPFVNISQARTEEVLDDTIVCQPLIDVRWSHRITGIAQSSTSVTVRCETPDGRSR